MKKLLLLLFVFAAMSASAQFRGSLGLELGKPMIDEVGVGIGISAAGEYGLSENMGITATLGYIYVTNDMDDVSTSIIPIMAGFKYYMKSNESGIYGHAQLGLQTLRVSMGELSLSTSNFAFGLGGGYMINSNIDIGLSYTYTLGSDKSDGFGYIGLRAAYWF